jgi:PAS domain S-box-containing protein
MDGSSIPFDGADVAAASMDGVGLLSGTEYVTANDALAEIHGYETTQNIVGRSWDTLYSIGDGEATASDLLDRVRREGDWRGRAFARRPTGERVPVDLSMRRTDDGVVCIARDVTEQRERERERERYQTILETVDDGIYVLDECLRVETANDRFFELLSHFGISRAEARNRHVHELIPREEDRASLEAAIEEAIETEPHTGSFEMVAETSAGECIVCESRFRLYPKPNGEHRGCIGILRDITERKERERELQAARQFNQELVENAPFSMVRIDEEFRITYVNPRTEEVTGLPDGKESEALGVDIRELPSVAETGQAHLFTPLQEGETIEFEFPFESIYGREVYFTGRGVPLLSDGEFDGAVLMSVDISERHQHEKDLERQRDELDTLNRINELLLAVSRDLFESPLHGNIEATVCVRLANSHLYQCAWIGKPEVGGRRLIPDVSAGIDDAGIESIPIPTDNDATVQGPASRAFRTGTIQTSQARETDPLFEPWRDGALDRDVRSVAAVPLTYDGSTYGVLAVYASRPLAFSQREQRGFEMLGEAIGYAINANRTRQRLFAQKVVELEIRLPDTEEFFSRMATRLGCRLSMESHVSTRSGSWLLYFSTGDSDVDRLVKAARDEPAVDAVRSIGQGEESLLAITAESALLDTVAALGGTVSEASIAAGRGEFVVQVPQSTDIGEFVEQLHSTYSGLQILAKRDNERPVDPSNRVIGDGCVDLTDRQRQALEAAYRSGYFEWPRENAATDVAELLGISRPTFQAHLRKAEKELFSVFFTGSDHVG